MVRQISANSRDLRYYLCPGSNPLPEFREVYEKIYQCWREVWEDAYRELKVSKTLYSELFTRQDYVGAVFHKDKCVALTFFRWGHAQESVFQKDSYFSNWTTEHIAKLRSRGDKIIVCSHFTLHPDARGETLGVSGKDLLMGMIIETFMNSKADAMTGAARVNRRVSDATFRWGAYKIEGDVPSGFGDATVDLIGFFKDYINEQPKHELSDLAHKLWVNRTTIPRMSVEDEFEIQTPRIVRKAG